MSGTANIVTSLALIRDPWSGCLCPGQLARMAYVVGSGCRQARTRQLEIQAQAREMTCRGNNSRCHVPGVGDRTDDAIGPNWLAAGSAPNNRGRSA